MKPAVYAVATMDTKRDELAYVAQCLRDAGVAVKTVDVSTLDDSAVVADVPRRELIGEKTLPAAGDRGTAVTAMGEALTDYLLGESAAGRVAGVIGIGGSG